MILSPFSSSGNSSHQGLSWVCRNSKPGTLVWPKKENFTFNVNEISFVNVNQVCTLLSPLKSIFLGKFTSHAPANLKKTKMKQSKKQKTMQHSKGSFEGLFVHVFLDLPVNLPYSFFVAVFSLVRLGTELSTLHVLRRHCSHWAPFFAPHSISSCGREFQQLCRDRVIPGPSMIRARGPARPSTELRYKEKHCYRVSVCARKCGGGTQTPSFLRDTERNKDRCSCLQVPPQTCYSLGGWLSLSRSLLLRSALIEIKPHP